MKIVAATRVLDEADIIESFVRHTSFFSSHHVFIDNGSNDGTLEILKNLSQEGLGITVFQNKSVHYNELTSNTFLYDYASKNLDADWIIFVDVDEFIDDRKIKNGLKSYLSDLAERKSPTHCVKVPMVNYNYTRQDSADEVIVPKRITHRSTPTNVYKIIANGRIPDANISIANGSHDLLIDGESTQSHLVEENIWLAHYSERYPLQIAAKFFKGWAKILAAGSELVNSGASSHYKAPYYIIKDRPQDLLRNEWFMTRKNESPDLIVDPIDYKGGNLLYTNNIDKDMLVIRSLAGYMNDLATQHGRIMDCDPNAKALVKQWSSSYEKLF